MSRTLYFVFFLGLLTSRLHAQMEVVDATVPPYSPENLITNYFLGEGIKVTSVKYEGAASGVGFFNKAGNVIGIEKGIVLTNGIVASTGVGTNRKFGVDAKGIQIASNDNKENPVDPDINSILKSQSGGTQKSTNLSKYTISFIPSADTLRFRYVFASEEYPEFICDRYNDVFGFFISGPGIVGPYENNGVNIALIPGTSLPVTINNINLGKGTINCAPKFPQFYNNNDQTNFEPVYDGFLDVFTAQAIVQPCQEYSIKIIVADVGDANFDSGVFLEAKSFGTKSVTVQKVTQAQDDFIIEGCSEGTISFKIPQKADRDIPINCKIIGTAINGIDYKRIPTDFFIPEGDSLLKVRISAFEDNTIEGIETLGFVFEKDACTRDTFWFFINENTLVSAPRNVLRDTLICRGKEITLDATANITIPNGRKFDNAVSVPVSTVFPNSGVIPTVVPISVSNVSPSMFSPSIIESVCVNIQHVWIDDIDLYLIAPNGQFIALSTDNGGSGDNYINTCFSAGAVMKISDGAAPFTGEWLPEEPFDNLLLGNGANPTNGVWKLMVIDDQPGLDGVLINWSITFRSGYKIDYKWIDSQDLSCQNCSVSTLRSTVSTEKTVIITDIHGCQIKDNVKVVVEDSLKAPEVLCSVTAHNSLTFSWKADSSIKSYEVRLNNGSWQNVYDSLSYQVSNLVPGVQSTIQLRGTGGNCFARTTTKVCTTIPCTTVLPELLEIKQISCNGRSDGSVKIGVRSGGVAPFRYTMGSIINDTGLFEGLSKGKYSVLIDNSFTCAAKIEFEITEPEKIHLKIAKDTLKCFGASDAKVSVAVNGGTPPYFFKWSNGTTLAQNNFISAGKYAVTVTDKNKCLATDSVIIVQPDPIRFKVNSYPVTCNKRKDGKAAIEIIGGGTGPFEYLWKSKSYIQVGSKIGGLGLGTYFFTITDTNGCVVTDSVAVANTPEVRLSTFIKGLKCHSDQNGEISVTPSGGSPPFTFDWSNGKKESLVKGLTAGIYRVSVTDKFNCQVLDSFSIPQVSILKTISKKIEDVKCTEGSDGECSILVIGGTGDISYQWSTGQTGEIIKDLKAGVYLVTASDANSCLHIDTIDVKQPDSIRLDSEIANVRCDSSSLGSLTIKVSGGVGPYYFLWSTKDTISNLTGLTEGAYQLTVTDFNGCSTVGRYKITSKNVLKVVAKISHQKCFKTSSGSIELVVSDGSPPYTFSWQSGESGNRLIDIVPGLYRFTVTDMDGCMLTDTAEVLAADSIDFMVKIGPVNCATTKTGNAFVEASGGHPPYLYSVNGSVFSSSNFYENLGAGEYKISVRDKFGCSSTKKIEIPDKIPMQIIVPNDTLIYTGDTLIVEPKIFNYEGTVKIQWFPGSKDVLSCDTCPVVRLFPQKGTWFQVRASDSVGCTVEKMFFLKVLRRNEIYVPTGFSPNNDGENDNLVVFGTKGAEVVNLEIFDRWGEAVFHSGNFQVNDTNFGWDGTFNGSRMPSGNYIWQCTIRFPDGTIKTEKGFVTLLK